MEKNIIGGSALIEGLLMIGPQDAAIAIRKPDGDIFIERRKLSGKSKLAKVPVIRGIISFLRQMLLSTKAMIFSAEFIEVEDESEEPLTERLLSRLFGGKMKDFIVYLSLVLSLVFSIGLFVLLPNIMAGFLHFEKSTSRGVISYNFFEGLIRMSLFLGYLVLTSRFHEMKRVWQYHGAEHKTINCYEDGVDLSIANVMKYSTKNRRCGTSYLFLVLMISILFFSLLGWYSLWMNMLIRLLSLPAVAGLSYEAFRYAATSDSKLAQMIAMPGLWFQKLTTAEPDEKQVEVAISAFNHVMGRNGNPEMLDSLQ